MNTSKIYLLTLLLPFICFANCSSKHKQRLELEAKKEMGVRTETRLSADEIFVGERKDEIRQIDKLNPPVIIDMTGIIEEKNLDLSSYFPSQKIVRLQHPRKEEGLQFKFPLDGYFFRIVKDTPFPTFNSTQVYKNWILVGNLSGLFCFSKEGEYLYTLTESDDFKNKKMSGTVELDPNSATNLLTGFSVVGDICLFTTITDGKSTIHLFDLVKGTEIHNKDMPAHNLMLLNANHKTWIDYVYDVASKETKPFMHSITADGDTLCSFTNQNVLVDMTGMSTYQNPGRASLYYVDDKLYVRQQGNDTIFRMQSEYELNPAYVFRTGDRKATIQDIIKGNIEDKYAINRVVDTDKLLLFSVRGSEDFYYYDKGLLQFCKSSNLFGINFEMDDLNAVNTILYSLFNKQSIQKTLKKAPASSTTDMLKKLEPELVDGEIAIVIME